MEFVGKSLALSPLGMAAVATRLSVGVAEIAAVFSVETPGRVIFPTVGPKFYSNGTFSRALRRDNTTRPTRA